MVYSHQFASFCERIDSRFQDPEAGTRRLATVNRACYPILSHSFSKESSCRLTPFL